MSRFKYSFLLLLFILICSSISNAQWVNQGAFPNSDPIWKSHTQGVTVDPDGKIWISKYENTSGIIDPATGKPLRAACYLTYIFNPDGSQAPFSPIFQVMGDTMYNVSPRGLRTNIDGNILLSTHGSAVGGALYMINYKTGLGIRKVALPNTPTAPCVSTTGTIFIGPVAAGTFPLLMFNQNFNLIGPAIQTTKGFSRSFEVSQNGNTIYWAGYTNGTVYIYKRADANSSFVLTDSIMTGVHAESFTWHPISRNLWISAGSFNDKPTKGYTIGTWYAWDFKLNKVVDSLKWQFTNQAAPEERPRALAFSNDGNTAYAGQYYVRGSAPMVQKFTKSVLYNSYTINLNSNPAIGGNVTGGGVCSEGQTITVNAVPNPGYSFDSWTENGIIITTNTSFGFRVFSNRNLVANFYPTYVIPTSSAKLNINNVSTYFSNDGKSDIASNGESGFEYPIGSGKKIFYESGLLYGGLVNGEWRVSGSAFRQGQVPGRIISTGTASSPYGIAENYSNSNVRIYRVRRDYKDPQANYSHEIADEAKSRETIYAQYDQDWQQWPAVYGAPYEDINKDGTYDPSIDIPGVPGADQTIWFVSNDTDPIQSRKLYGSVGLGIEMQTTIWGYNLQNALNNTIFRKYKIINKGYYKVDSCYVNMFSDPDLGGDAGDDFGGCDTTLSLGYIYNGDDDDPSYGSYIPAAGFGLIQGPIIPGAATDNAMFNSRYKNGFKNMSMTSFYLLTQGNPIYADPTLGSYVNGALRIKNLFQGKVGTTGLPFTDPLTGKRSMYFAPGNPVNGQGWVDGILFPKSDKRIGLVSGPFNLAVGDTQEVVYAQMVAGGSEPSNRLDAVTLLKNSSQEVKTLYNYLYTNSLNRCNLVANPAQAGNVTQSGSGSYLPGTSVTVTASPNPDYIFINWTENGNIVSTSKTFTFIANKSRVIVANFIQQTPIIVTYSCNMQYEITSGRFNPATDFVELRGSEFGWTAGVRMEQNPNQPNIYSVTVTQKVTAANEKMPEYKFWYSSNKYGEFWENDQNRTHTITLEEFNNRAVSIQRVFDDLTTEIITNREVSILIQINLNGGKDVNGNPLPSQINTIHLTGSAAPLSWNGWWKMDNQFMLQMYDDGTHGDLVRNDKIYSNLVKFPIYSRFRVEMAYVINYNITQSELIIFENNINDNHEFNLEKDLIRAKLINTYGFMSNYGEIVTTLYDKEYISSVEKTIAADSFNKLINSVSGKLQNDIAKSFDFFNKSLDAKLWLDENHLTAQGQQMFESSKSAVSDLMKLSKESIYAVSILPIIKNMYNVDKYVVELFYSELLIKYEQLGCGTNPTSGNCAKWKKDLDDASSILTMAKSDFASGNFDKAITNLKQAWVNLNKVQSAGLAKEMSETLTQVEIPTEFNLAQNYPNPFNPTTVIKFGLPTNANISIRIYDILGQEVSTLVEGYYFAGVHLLEFGAKNLSNGVYIYRINAVGEDGSKYAKTLKMVLMK